MPGCGVRGRTALLRGPIIGRRVGNGRARTPLRAGRMFRFPLFGVQGIARPTLSGEKC